MSPTFAGYARASTGTYFGTGQQEAPQAQIVAMTAAMRNLDDSPVHDSSTSMLVSIGN